MTVSHLVVWLLAVLSLPIAQEDGLSLSAQAGFDGLYEGGSAIPLVVLAANNGPPIEGEIQVLVPTAGENLIYSTPISLPSGSDKRIPLVVHTSSFASDLEVQLVSDGRVFAETNTNRLNSVGRDELFYGVLSSDPGGLAFLETIPGERTDAAVAFLAPTDLPEVSSAWNGLDVLVFDDIDTSRLTPAQVAALRAWVEGGGQLVVTGGPGGPQTAAGVTELLPVTVSGTASVDDLSALGEFAGEPVSAPGPYVITQSNLTDGEVLIEQDGLPILARRDMGRGGVYFLALDPKLAPLSGWRGSDTLWNDIAAHAPLLPPWAAGIQDGYAATQAVSYIPGLRLPSAWQLILFLLVYTVTIGPVNFLILRRLNRRELAWITIPALVLLFSAITFLTGFRSRGNSATLNVMTVAFGSAEAEQLRAQSVMGLYSPRRARYDVNLPYQATSFPFQQGFGTLINSGNVGAIERAGELILRDVRTDTSEVATFIVETQQPRPPIDTEAILSVEKGTIDVTIRNNSDHTLEDAVIIYGPDQAAVGDVPPGGEETVVVSLSSGLSAIPTPDPLFTGGFTYPNPLINDPSLILGTPDYFNDPDAYPRWQLIQSTYTGESNDAIALPAVSEVVTLAGFLPYSDQEASVSSDRTDQTGLTLLLMEIPTR